MAGMKGRKTSNKLLNPPVLWIQKHLIWIRIQDFGPIWIRIQDFGSFWIRIQVRIRIQVWIRIQIQGYTNNFERKKLKTILRKTITGTFNNGTFFKN